MRAQSIPGTLILFMATTLSAANAQTIDSERLKIDQYQQEVKSLQQSNSDIEAQLRQLDQKITASARSYAPEEKARNNAESRYQKALQVAADTPSTANRERAEAARFDYLMADRKYQRSSQDVKRLIKQQKALKSQLTSNQKTIGKTGKQVKQQQDLMLGMAQQAHRQAAEQLKTERRLRLKKEAALRASHNELAKIRRQYAAATAEIARLKTRLAATESRATVATVSAAPTTSHTTVATAKPLPGNSASNSLQGNKEQYISLLETAGLKRGARSRSNKILHVRTFRNNRLSKQTSHSLKYLGNGVYQGKTVVRAGDTAFIVGNKKWQWTIPETDNKKQYIFTLDSRNKANPKLKLFARSDVQ